MSTFIYTLQRKVQELQKTLRSLQEQNYNLRNRARMLSEAAPPPPPPGDGVEVSDAPQQMTQTYGGLGSSAFLTRTTQAPGGAQNWWEDPKYFGFSLNGVNNKIIQGGNIDQFLRNTNRIVLADGTVIYLPQTPLGEPMQYSERQIYQMITATMMANPAFNLANFASAAQMLEAFAEAITQAAEEGRMTASARNSILSRISYFPGGQSPIPAYFQAAWESINRTGSWNMNSPPPQF
jgi:hypothetical protein